MRKSTLAAQLMRTTVLTGAALAFAMPAFAQEDDEIIVTGSRIPQANLESVSPITQVDASEFEFRGTIRTEDLINQLPQVFAGQNQNLSNGATGTATVDLRGLGPARTLVLVNGRRLPYGSPLSIPADLNQIPADLIERVEVLTGGASAVYGSDAISGVVNFIMQDDFEGIRFDAQYSFFQHTNRNDVAQDTLALRGFPIPDGGFSGGDAINFSITAGANIADGRGNVTAYLGYRQTDPVLQGSFDTAACAQTASGSSPTGFTCGGSSTNATGRFFSFTNGADLTIDPTSGAIRPYVGATDAFNFAPLNFYQRPDERYSAGVYGHYDITDSIEFYTEFNFMDNETDAQIAPSGFFFGNPAQLNCDNPLIAGGFDAAIGCTAPGDVVDLFIGRRNVEGGGRNDNLRLTSYRFVTGFRGDLGENWAWDVYGMFSNVHLAEVYTNDFSIARVGRALDVVTDPTTLLPACRSFVDGTDPSCVPWNIFSLNGVDTAALNYLQTPGFIDGNTRQQVVSASLTGDLGAWGFKSPAAESGVGIAFGAEYRDDELEVNSDIAFCDRGSPPNTDLAGQGGPTCPTAGGQDVYDLFVEARVPLIENAALFKALVLDLGYRFSDYELAGTTHTYKLGATWALSDDLTFRGSYNKATRAPNVIELFAPNQVALFGLSPGANGLSDPCAGPSPTATLAQCLNTGLSAAQFGSPVLNNPADQYNQFIGGNDQLDPEDSRSWTVGAVLTPTFVDNFVLSVDYFNITLDNVVGTIGAEETFNRCLNTGDPTFCSLITREPVTGALFVNGGGVINTNQNLGSIKTAGLDFNSSYNVGIGGFGDLGFNYIGTYLRKLETVVLPGDAAIACEGLFAAFCGSPNPKYRHRFITSWQSPYNLDVNVTWRYFSGVDHQTVTTGRDAAIGSQNYFDVGLGYDVFENVRATAGVNNIFDRDPPLVSNGIATNGNTFPNVYDALGRYLFFGVSAEF